MDSHAELDAVHGRLAAAAAPLSAQAATTCCYAHSEKSWSRDPDGIAWETFLTSGESAVYGSDDSAAVDADAAACCTQPSPGQGDKQAACCAHGLGAG